MDIRKENEKFLNKLPGWKYWDIFEREINAVPKDQRLSTARSIIEDCQEDVEARAESQDLNLSQVRRSVAGRYFQGFITNETLDVASENGYRILHDPTLSNHPELSNASLDIGGLTVEPDTDIVYYEPDADSPIYIFSCKTSLRERLAQSGMWQIVYQMAGHDCSDPECPTNSYTHSGTLDREVYAGFITLDWYEEVPNNDVIDLLDITYVANPSSVDRSRDVYPLEKLPDHIEKGWSNV
jgi:hypothetical protein